MSTSSKIQNYQPWPELSYESFKPTAHLLHMFLQAVGKLKLLTPFEPHWANVPLWLTSNGLTTGPIPYHGGTFSVDVDLIAHRVHCITSWGDSKEFELGPSSVALLVKKLLDTLHSVGVEVKINPKPQEIPNPVPFDQDTDKRPYDAQQVNAWWRIMVSSHQVIKRYRARFLGITPPIGFMWGTFDLRDARYKNTPAPLKSDADFIFRNAMDVAQVEVGWWSGNPAYPHPAYFSFTYPKPDGIENAKVKPASVHWEAALGLFVLDYDQVRQSKNPAQELLEFFESTYQAGAKLAGWDQSLVSDGKPV